MPLVASSHVHVFKESRWFGATLLKRPFTGLWFLLWIFGYIHSLLMTVVYNVCMYFVQPVQHFGQLRFF